MGKFNGGTFVTSGAGAGTTANGSTLPINCEHAEKIVVLFSGTWTGNAFVEISADGTNWAQFGSTLTANGTVDVTVPCKQIRVTRSGSPTGTVVGTYGLRDDDRAA